MLRLGGASCNTRNARPLPMAVTLGTSVLLESISKFAALHALESMPDADDFAELAAIPNGGAASGAGGLS